jgi:hypothetical protein
MEFGMGRFQVRDRATQVALGGGKGTMPQKVLDVPQVGAVLNAMGGTSVSPNMAENAPKRAPS